MHDAYRTVFEAGGYPETGSGIWETDGYWTISDPALAQWMEDLSYGGTYMLSEDNREAVRQLLRVDFVEFFDPQIWDELLFVGCKYEDENQLAVACFERKAQNGYDLLRVIREKDLHPCESGMDLWYCDYNDLRVFLILNRHITAMEWAGDCEKVISVDRHPAVVVESYPAEQNAKYRFCYGDGGATTMFMDHKGVAAD